MNMDMNMFNYEALKATAVDSGAVKNFLGGIDYDCLGMNSAEAATKIFDDSPLVKWLWDTSLSAEVRRTAKNGSIGMHQDSTGAYVLEVPRPFWTEEFPDTTGECCWSTADFAKCAPNVPLNMLCLKDCENIMDYLVNSVQSFDERSAIKGITTNGENKEVARRRIAKMQFGFLQAYTIVNGTVDAATGVLKPFHGLLEVMSDDAVMAIPASGGTVLPAFEQLACRLRLLDAGNDFVLAANPLVYSSVLSQITPDIYGRFPTNWTRNGDEIRFMNIPFIQDHKMIVDTTSNAGDIYLLHGGSVGVFTATDLITNDARFSFKDQFAPGTGEVPSCGSKCDYHYNMGAVFANNANKLAVLSGVSIGNGCMNAVSDLTGLVNPTTLIPRGIVEAE